MADDNITGFTKASELSDKQYYLVSEPTATVLARPYSSVDELREDNEEKVTEPGMKAATGEVLELVQQTSNSGLSWANDE